MPDPNAVSEWMTEVTVSMERLHGRQEAVEKSVDGLRVEVRDAAAAATAAALALSRIARADEDRLAFQKAEAEKQRAFEKDQAEQRNKWVERVWTSPVLQLLLTGLVVACLQFLGVAWLYSQMPAQVVSDPPTIERPATPGGATNAP